jgi:hypothetical protein
MQEPLLSLTLIGMTAWIGSLLQWRLSRNKRIFPDENIIQRTTEQYKQTRCSAHSNKQTRVALDPSTILQNFLSDEWRLWLHCFLFSDCKQKPHNPTFLTWSSNKFQVVIIIIMFIGLKMYKRLPHKIKWVTSM